MLSRCKKSIGMAMALVLLLGTVMPTLALAADEPKAEPAAQEAPAGAPASCPDATAEVPAAAASGQTVETKTTLLTYEQGVKDGKKQAEEHYQDTLRQAGWFAAGIGFGAIGTGVAYFKKPTHVAEGYLADDSYSPEYKKGFVDGFCEVAKRKRAGAAGIGWATWVAILLASGGGGD